MSMLIRIFEFYLLAPKVVNPNISSASAVNSLASEIVLQRNKSCFLFKGINDKRTQLQRIFTFGGYKFVLTFLLIWEFLKTSDLNPH